MPNLNIWFPWYSQVVEIVDHYDQECLPPEYLSDPLTFIKNSKTNKTCSRRLTVSTISILTVGNHIGFWFISCLSLNLSVFRSFNSWILFRFLNQWKVRFMSTISLITSIKITDGMWMFLFGYWQNSLLSLEYEPCCLFHDLRVLLNYENCLKFSI